MIVSPPPIIPTLTFNPPTPTVADLHVPTNVLTALLVNEQAECINIFQCRTTTNIVLSSLTTIFTCTWVALHLNTPKSNLSPWGSFCRRLWWMIKILIVPELSVWEAAKDLFGAKGCRDTWNTNFVKLCSPEIIAIPGKTTEQYERELKDKQHNGHWTLTHGFLAKMGGIKLHYDGHDNPQVFGLDQETFEDPEMRPVIQQIGLISARDIQDKSKGDGMSKLFVVLQTTWFTIQCLARWSVRLPVTELEVVALSYTVLNTIVYALWWHKPQGLSVPFRVYLQKGRSELNPEKQTARSVSEEEGWSVAEDTSNEEEMSMLRSYPSPTMVDEELNTLPPNELKWVPPTYSRIERPMSFLHDQLGDSFFPVLAASIFGAIHLIPVWVSVFPSDVERKLWQVSAVYVAVGPPSLLIVEYVVLPLIKMALNRAFFDTNYVMDIICGCGLVPYAVARVILLVLTFTTLRSLPKEAFQNIEWTRFIPHF